MITVSVRDDGNKWQMTMDGHARYAEPGEDIVCAAASILWYTLLLELGESCDHFETEGPEDAPYAVTACGCRRTMRTILRGFRFLADSYPDHIAVTGG